MITHNLFLIVGLCLIGLISIYDFEKGRIAHGLALLIATAVLCYGIK